MSVHWLLSDFNSAWGMKHDGQGNQFYNNVVDFPNDFENEVKYGFLNTYVFDSNKGTFQERVKSMPDTAYFAKDANKTSFVVNRKDYPDWNDNDFLNKDFAVCWDGTDYSFWAVEGAFQDGSRQIINYVATRDWVFEVGINNMFKDDAQAIIERAHVKDLQEDADNWKWNISMDSENAFTEPIAGFSENNFKPTEQSRLDINYLNDITIGEATPDTMVVLKDGKQVIQLKNGVNSIIKDYNNFKDIAVLPIYERNLILVKTRNNDNVYGVEAIDLEGKTIKAWNDNSYKLDAYPDDVRRWQWNVFTDAMSQDVRFVSTIVTNQDHTTIWSWECDLDNVENASVQQHYIDYVPRGTRQWETPTLFMDDKRTKWLPMYFVYARAQNGQYQGQILVWKNENNDWNYKLISGQNGGENSIPKMPLVTLDAKTIFFTVRDRFMGRFNDGHMDFTYSGTDFGTDNPVTYSIGKQGGLITQYMNWGWYVRNGNWSRYPNNNKAGTTYQENVAYVNGNTLYLGTSWSNGNAVYEYNDKNNSTFGLSLYVHKNDAINLTKAQLNDILNKGSFGIAYVQLVGGNLLDTTFDPNNPDNKPGNLIEFTSPPNLSLNITDLVKVDQNYWIFLMPAFPATIDGSPLADTQFNTIYKKIQASPYVKDIRYAPFPFIKPGDMKYQILGSGDNWYVDITNNSKEFVSIPSKIGDVSFKTLFKTNLEAWDVEGAQYNLNHAENYDTDYMASFNPDNLAKLHSNPYCLDYFKTTTGTMNVIYPQLLESSFALQYSYTWALDTNHIYYKIKDVMDEDGFYNSDLIYGAGVAQEFNNYSFSLTNDPYNQYLSSNREQLQQKFRYLDQQKGFLVGNAWASVLGIGGSLAGGVIGGGIGSLANTYNKNQNINALNSSLRGRLAEAREGLTTARNEYNDAMSSGISEIMGAADYGSIGRARGNITRAENRLAEKSKATSSYAGGIGGIIGGALGLAGSVVGAVNQYHQQKAAIENAIASQKAQLADLKIAPNTIRGNGDDLNGLITKVPLTPLKVHEELWPALKNSVGYYFQKYGSQFNGIPYNVNDFINNKWHLNTLQCQSVFENYREDIPMNNETRQITDMSLANGINIWHVRTLPSFQGINNYYVNNRDVELPGDNFRFTVLNKDYTIPHTQSSVNRGWLYQIETDTLQGTQLLNKISFSADWITKTVRKNGDQEEPFIWIGINVAKRPTEPGTYWITLYADGVNPLRLPIVLTQAKAVTPQEKDTQND